MTDAPPPRARIVPVRRWSWTWLIPLAVLALLITLGVQASSERPIAISVRFAEGSGLRAGDPVACRGVQVGEVREVRLAADASSVIIEIALARSASTLAVEGTRFWIVRPEVSLRGVSGLETILGPRTIAVEPGPLDAPRASSFAGLGEAPPIPEPTDGSLLLTLLAARRSSLGPGAPITYRDVTVGQVLDYRLADNATVVELTVAIDPAYAPLVRENTRFFNISGIVADWGIFKGLDIRTDSLESVIAGAIGLATPKKPGPRVASGHTFDLEPEAEADWLGWEPEIPLHPSAEPAPPG